MQVEKFQRDLKATYNTELTTLDKRIAHIVKHIDKEWNLDVNRLSLTEVQILANTILDTETQELHDEVESLLAQKEQIERKLEKKHHDLQESKYNVFDAIESHLHPENDESLSKLHQVKLQTIDIYDLLGEMVESAIISTLEKEFEINEHIEEVIRHIAYEAIEEGSLNTIRVKKILATILASSIDVAEASPPKAKDILSATLKGMRSALMHSITRFKQQLVYMPSEAKHILIEDYDTVLEDLKQSDAIFSQVIQTQAAENSSSIKIALEEINQEMRYDLEELVRISKETADLMKDKFTSLATQTIIKADQALNSPKAVEAKRMGKQALGIARTALDSALKTAKDAIDNKK